MNLTLDDKNDQRSNMIELLVRLCRKYELQGQEVHLQYENKHLHFVPNKGLTVEGCVDRVHLFDARYSSVSLGEKISGYHHLPYYWLQSLLAGE